MRLREGLSDRDAFRQVWLDRHLDPVVLGAPFNWKKIHTVVDIGAHIGMFTLFAAANAPSARVIALEPEQQNYRVLLGNVERNNLGNRITALQIGVGNGKPMTLYTFGADRGGDSVYRKNEGGSPIMIQTMSIGEVLRKYGIASCDLLRLNCQGAEYEALYETSLEDLQRINSMIIDYHHFCDNPTHSPDYLEEFLTKRGFRVARPESSMLFACRS